MYWEIFYLNVVGAAAILLVRRYDLLSRFFTVRA